MCCRLCYSPISYHKPPRQTKPTNEPTAPPPLPTSGSGIGRWVWGFVSLLVSFSFFVPFFRHFRLIQRTPCIACSQGSQPTRMKPFLSQNNLLDPDGGQEGGLAGGAADTFSKSKSVHNLTNGVLTVLGQERDVNGEDR